MTWLETRATVVDGKTLIMDSECAPLSYLSGDYTTGQVTAIAWKWRGDERVQCEVLSHAAGSLESMLLKFRDAWDEADTVVGHFARSHDFPVINGALLELGHPPLEPKMTVDSKSDLKVSRYISQSQESLAAMLGLDREKLHLTQADWRSANRLEPEGIRIVRERCISDVEQCAEMYERLRLLGWLTPPKLWDGSAKTMRYRP